MNETDTCPKCGHAYDSVLDMWSHQAGNSSCLRKQLELALARVAELESRLSDRKIYREAVRKEAL